MTKTLSDYQKQEQAIRDIVADLNAKVAQANRDGFRVEFQTSPIFSHDGPTYQTIDVELQLDLSVIDID